MSEQIFVSYRRDGGDVTAKLICEALKNRGYTVFYDYDSISGGYFDDRIITAIDECDDFILVLPPNALDRCANDDDWVRQEITCALKKGKNIIPIMAPDFVFPKDLPKDIEDVRRINGIQFVMAYFEAVMGLIVDRLISKPAIAELPPSDDKTEYSEGLEFEFDSNLNGYSVKKGKCADTVIVIPDTYDGKKVVAIGSSGFKDEKTVKEIIMPDTITKIGDHAFQGCIILEEVNIPKNVIEISELAFYGCNSLKRFVIPRNVAKIEYRALSACASLNAFSVEADNMHFCSVDGNLFTKDMKKLVAYATSKQDSNYVIPEGVEEIDDCAFACSKSLVSVTIPDSVKHIRDFAFYQCSSLESIVLPDSVLTVGENCFQGCSSLKSAVLSKSLTKISKAMFHECGALEAVDIPESVTSIEKWAFGICGSLASIVIPKNVSSIGAMAFSDCISVENFSVSADNEFYCTVDGNLYTKDMKTLVTYVQKKKDVTFVLPDGVQNIEECAFLRCRHLKNFVASKSLQSIADFAFFECGELEKVTLPKDMNRIGFGAFKGCKRLESIAVPKGITFIDEEVFKSCSALKSVSLPRGLLGIGEGAFYECTSLESVSLPDSITDIGRWAFYGCSSLKKFNVTKNIKNLGVRFLTKCTALESISVSSFNKNYCSCGKHLYTKDRKTVVAYAIGSKDISYEIPESVARIEECAFAHSPYLMTVSIPRDLDSMGDLAMHDCKLLKQINYKSTVYSWKSVTVGKSVFTKSAAKQITCTDGVVNIQ